jgi:hypothetical protein
MHVSQLGKEVRPMASKVGIGTLVCADVQECTNDLDGQNFAIGKHWLRAALAKLPSTLLKPIVSESKYAHKECVKIHLGDLLYAPAFLIPKRKMVSFL